MGTAIGVGFWVQGDELLELHARGELIRGVFLAAYGLRRRALLAEGASEAQAHAWAVDEADAITHAAFPGWDFDTWSENEAHTGKVDRMRGAAVPFEEPRPGVPRRADSESPHPRGEPQGRTSRMDLGETERPR
jgi:hypothetical protein